MRFIALLPGQPGVGDDQFLLHDQPIYLDLLLERAVRLLQGHDSTLQFLDFAFNGVEVLIGADNAGKEYQHQG
jgi:hypothetical protein